MNYYNDKIKLGERLFLFCLKDKWWKVTRTYSRRHQCANGKSTTIVTITFWINGGWGGGGVAGDCNICDHN